MKLITDNGETIEIEAMRAIGLQPDDLIIMRSQDTLCEEVIQRIKNIMKKHIPNHDIILLDGGMDIEVLRNVPHTTGKDGRRKRYETTNADLGAAE